MTEPMQPSAEPVIEVAPSFFEEYKVQVIAGGVVVALLLVGYAVWQITAMNARESAMAEYARAATVEEFAAVADGHRRQTVAANALVQLSALLRAEGNMEESDAALQRVLDDHPDHPLVGTAMLGLAANREAAGDTEGAVEIYRQIPAKFSGSHAAAIARLAEARLLALREDIDGAALIYEDIVVSHANTPAAMIARSELAQLDALRTQPATGEPAEAQPPDAGAPAQ